MIESLQMLKQIVFPALIATSKMLFISSFLGMIIGFVLAVAVVLTNKDGLMPNKVIFQIVDFVINIIRSFPFIILVVALIPFTRIIVGTSIGSSAAIIPLTIASAANSARLIEGNLSSVDKSLIEAAQSFGATNYQIVMKVMFKECVPDIVFSFTVILIGTLGMTAMAGTVGAGGLGSVAMIYGYQGFNDVIMYGTVCILVIIVEIIQIIGMKVYKKMSL